MGVKRTRKQRRRQTKRGGARRKQRISGTTRRHRASTLESKEGRRRSVAKGRNRNLRRSASPNQNQGYSLRRDILRGPPNPEPYVFPERNFYNPTAPYSLRADILRGPPPNYR
jgi:hypothetical protein